MNPIIGTVVRDRYRIVKLLGEGADKQVYLAEDVRLYDTRRAVAVMIDSITDSEKQKSAARAFELEAEMLTRLKHPRVPQIYDRFSEANIHYLVMEFVEGETLQAKLDRVPGNRLPEPEAVSIAIKVLAVLDYLHRRTPPVIFRDLKPDNIILQPDGELKLIDFGIARFFRPTGSNIGRGTVGYAAPEQYQGAIDARSDIYALGATLHHMLTGRDPAQHFFDFPPILQLVPNCDPNLTACIDSALQRDPAKRPQSAAEFRDRIRIGQNSGVSRPKDVIARQASGGLVVLGEAEASAPTVQLTVAPCVRCGGQISSEENFCTKCGASRARSEGISDQTTSSSTYRVNKYRQSRGEDFRLFPGEVVHSQGSAYTQRWLMQPRTGYLTSERLVLCGMPRWLAFLFLGPLLYLIGPLFKWKRILFELPLSDIECVRERRFNQGLRLQTADGGKYDLRFLNNRKWLRLLEAATARANPGCTIHTLESHASYWPAAIGTLLLLAGTWWVFGWNLTSLFGTHTETRADVSRENGSPTIPMTNAISQSADGKPWKDEYVNKDIQAVCDKLDNSPFPPQDAPTEADKAALKGCSSRGLYYGIAVSTDYTAARKCAFVERGTEDSPVVGGSSVLMMIYANGYGVEKDLDLAIKAACEAGGAPAELEGRVRHLSELETKPIDQPLKECLTDTKLPTDYCNGKVDICDDITSGLMMGYCASIHSDNTEAGNNASIKRLISHWRTEDQKAFSKLSKAAAAYFDAHAENEINLAGSGRAAFSIEEKDSMMEQFRAAIRTFESGKVPSYLPEDFDRADKSLNVVYAAAMNKVSKPDEIMGISKDGIRRTQRLWLTYRDTWVTFAALHYSNISAESIETWLTLGRVGVIKVIPLGDFGSEANHPTVSVSPSVVAESVPTSMPEAEASVTPAANVTIPMNQVRNVSETSPVYQEPDPGSAILDSIHEGKRVRIIGEVGNYFEIRKLNGTVGFVTSSSLN